MLTLIQLFLNYIFKIAIGCVEKPKPPIRFEIEFSSKRKENLYGTAIFHDEKLKISVKPSKNIEVMRIPFNILGIMNEIHLVRFSGKTGAYTEYRPKIQNSLKKIEIESDEMLNDLIKSKKKYDTIEIFVN